MFVASGYIVGTGVVQAAYVNSDGALSGVVTQTFSLLPSRTGTRRYVIAMTWASSSYHPILSATIGGVAASIRSQIKIGDASDAAIFDAIVPDDGGDAIVVTFDGALGSNPLTWLSVYDVGDALYSADDIDNASGNSISMSVAAKRGDFVIGCATAYRLLTAGAFSWTGLTEDSDVVIRDNRCSAASIAVAADGTVAVTATSSAANECVGVIAVYTSPG